MNFKYCTKGKIFLYKSIRGERDGQKETEKKRERGKKKLFGHDREATPGSKICWRGSHKQY